MTSAMNFTTTNLCRARRIRCPVSGTRCR